jgi:chemotaxis protein methyltransferase CheR
MNDQECARFLQDVLPSLHMRWPGFRKVHRQVCKRIQRRIAQLGLPGVRAYRAYLGTHQDEWRILDGFCRITVSRFYRDRRVFQCLESDVIPQVLRQLRRAGERTLKAWSAGCASPEEPDPLAVIWEFCFASLCPDIEIQILATDTDENMLHRARIACYPFGNLKDLPPLWREVAFLYSNERYCLKERYRAHVKIMDHDVRMGPPDGPYHLLLCRNLAFTYFDEKLQHETAMHLSASLRPSGALIIGAGEQLAPGMRDFEPWGCCPEIYRKVSAA